MSLSVESISTQMGVVICLKKTGLEMLSLKNAGNTGVTAERELTDETRSDYGWSVMTAGAVSHAGNLM